MSNPEGYQIARRLKSEWAALNTDSLHIEMRWFTRCTLAILQAERVPTMLTARHKASPQQLGCLLSHSLR
jgi:hypothetical protein